MHGTTFGGNPLACAVAIAVIDEIKRSNLLGYIADLGSYFSSCLRELMTKHASIIDVRGLGLMIGVEISSERLAKDVLQGMLDHHILLNRTHERVLRFLPPFLITRDQINETIQTLDALLTSQELATSTHRATVAGEPING
jgi:acetylornithine aminotransferase/acetylornithine/N-succinyldiaminopimelate aminotransferase